jgi:hypothetical protein
MKKIILVFVLAIFPALAFSQSIFDKYEDMEHVGSITVNKGLIRLAGNLAALDKEDEDAQNFSEIAQGLTGIRVFVTEDKEVSADMGITVKKYLKSTSLEELMRVKDGDTSIKFYIRNGKDEDHVAELLMFVSGIENDDFGINGRKFESVLVSLTGDIDLNKISSLTKQMDLPKELNQAGKKSGR